MRTRTLAPLALAVVAAFALLPSADAAPRSEKPAATAAAGRYIVVYKPSVASVDAETNGHERGQGFKSRFRFRHAVKGFAAKLSDAQVRKLRVDPDVAFVSPDGTVRALGAVPLARGEAMPPAGVRRIQAASATTAREASDVAVAVIDTGVDLSHPDLNAVTGTNCVTPGAPATDDNGHGTHVAGTIAARNNGAGIVGVAPDTRVYAVKVLDAEGAGTWSQVICGIDWVAANSASLDIKVANMSLGGLGSNDRNCGATDGDPLHAAICRATQAGVLHVVAAGNDGWDIGDSPPDVPSSYPEVLTVTAMTDTDGAGGRAGAAPCQATEADDAYATFSNYATRPADKAHMVAAPGTCVVSTWPGGRYATLSGTSMATPHVAGAVALCIGDGGVAGACAGKSPAEIIAQVRADAEAYSTANSAYGFAGDPLTSPQGNYFGFLARVAPDTAPPDTAIASGPGGFTKNSAPSFAFAATQRGVTFECRVDAGAWAGCVSPRTTTVLADGAHSFEVRATDAAGNVDATPASRSFTVDTVEPETRIASGPAALTNDPAPSFAFAASESATTFECRLDSGTWSQCSSPHTIPPVADGSHSLEVRATDAAGNTDTTAASSFFTVDTVRPDTSITAGPAGRTKNATPTFGFSATEASSRFECRVDSGAWADCASPHTTLTLASGAHSFDVRATDAAGNTDASAASRSFSVETLAWGPPRASSEGATDVTADAATLSGLVNPSGDATAYHFEYGTSPAYGLRTPEQSAGEDGEDVSVSARVAGLAPGTTYHYRVVATSASGTAQGEDRTFTTPAAPTPPPVSPPPPPPETLPGPTADVTAPTVSVAIARQRLVTAVRKGVKASVSCSEACTISVQLVLAGPTAKRLGLSRGAPVVVGRRSVTLAAAQERVVVVKLSRKASTRLARAGAVTLAVRITATDAARNASTISAKVRLR